MNVCKVHRTTQSFKPSNLEPVRLDRTCGCGADLSAFELPRQWPWFAAGGAVLALLLLGRDEEGSAPPTGGPYAVAASRKRFGPLLDSAGASFGVPASMMRAVAWVESRWNPLIGSNKGALGLMQLMPDTAKNLGVTDRTDPAQNARGGAQFLASLYKKAGGWPVALAAYNWGPGFVFGSSTRAPSMYSSQWPVETQQYVREVLDAQARGVV